MVSSAVLVGVKRLRQLLIGLRAADGSAATPPPLPQAPSRVTIAPPRPTSPAPAFTNWGSITPFLLTSGDQFRPSAPPPVSSTAYASALNQVRAWDTTPAPPAPPIRPVCGGSLGTAGCCGPECAAGHQVAPC